METDKNLDRPLNYYNFFIRPKLNKIDIFLKMSNSYEVKDTAKVLEISNDELKLILKTLNIKKITRTNFLSIMELGSSDICCLMKRELDCGSPTFYTAKQISYIYNLNLKDVKNAFKFLSLKVITSSQIPLILAQI